VLAEEYILIVPFAYHLLSVPKNKAEQQNNINCINFTRQQFGLKDHRISAQQKALTVARNFVTTLSMGVTSANTV
jgi:hypothetical protein